MDEFTRDSFGDRLEFVSYKKWIEESHQLAIDYCYNGINPGDTPSDDYMERGEQIVRSQLTIAGYRMADSLKYVYEQAIGS